MKISKKDLRKIILESMIKEQEAGGSEEVSQSFLGQIRDMGADALKQVDAAVDSAMGNESDKSGDAAKAGEESEEAPAEKTGSKKIKKSTKTEYIQNNTACQSMQGINIFNVKQHVRICWGMRTFKINQHVTIYKK